MQTILEIHIVISNLTFAELEVIKDRIVTFVEDLQGEMEIGVNIGEVNNVQEKTNPV